MSWVSDYFGNQYKRYTDVSDYMAGQIRSVIPNVGFGSNIRDLYSGYQNFMKSESNKSGLRGTEFTTFLRGWPFLGGLVGGVEGVNQLEDLYDNSGKIAAYSSLQAPGASGIGSAGFGFGKMAEGNNDLYAFYTGDPKDPMFG